MGQNKSVLQRDVYQHLKSLCASRPKNLANQKLKELLKGTITHIPNADSEAFYTREVWDSVGVKLYNAISRRDKTTAELLPACRVLVEICHECPAATPLCAPTAPELSQPQPQPASPAVRVGGRRKGGREQKLLLLRPRAGSRILDPPALLPVLGKGAAVPACPVPGPLAPPAPAAPRSALAPAPRGSDLHGGAGLGSMAKVHGSWKLTSLGPASHRWAGHQRQSLLEMISQTVIKGKVREAARWVSQGTQETALSLGPQLAVLLGL
ncbi:uncharacterized protein LOC132334788 isoform X2 [Haemorhous mexicanus]|uniref:uncharacterized protein LOC132334788 isoform X2 n=1 Tax=Haemorhous mexicanus TaxID=30427 RepID=UPI0028BF00AF|nr:uncharacterized protein LOC132334788 isoform X2 [Haemorhous mexicanus]